ncbi:MAG: RNA polymerase sigma factor [Myxococcaceae bacterium]
MNALAMPLFELGAARVRMPDADPLLPLVERVRDGDPAAFDALYRQTRSEVHAVLYRLVGSNADMEDLVQEAYVQLLKALRGFRREARFSTFIYRVCANVGLMHLRSKRRRPEDPVAQVPEGIAGHGSDPERAAQVSAAARMMKQALELMDPKKRVTFVYHDLLDMKPGEIALALDTSANTVRSRLNRAREEFSVIVARLKKGAGDEAA